MRLEGTHLFAAPRQAVWDALMDPAVLASALPGGEQLELAGENQYRAVMNVKVGPVQGRFDGKIELLDIVAPKRYVMRVDGQGAPGFVNGAGQLHVDEEEGGTLLTYAGDVNVGGRIAGVGQRLVESTARSVTRQGLTLLDQMIQARVLEAAGEMAPGEMAAVTTADDGVVAGQAVLGGPAPAAPLPLRSGGPGGSAAAQTPQVSMLGLAGEVARDVAKDLTKEYIPEDKQERAYYFSV